MKSLNKKQREQLKQMFGGRCAYCGCELGEKWHADHVEPVFRQGKYVRTDKPGQTYVFKANGILSRPQNDRHDNFMPACIPCNIHKSTHTVETFRKMLTRHTASLNTINNYSLYRHAKRFGLVQETGADVIFFFEKQQIQKAMP